MSHVSGTTLITVTEITLTQDENYPQAEGKTLFCGQSIKVIAFGRTAEALAANQNVELTVTSKIFGGSSRPYLKVEQVISAAAPATPAIDDETVTNLKQVLTLKSK
ncbi:MAG: hypothetical protein WBM86_08435, partial [Waterburya sp.]